MEAVDRSQTERKGWRGGHGRWSAPRLVSLGCALAAGFAMRAWMLGQFYQANGDTFLYGDIALNLLRHGVYGVVQGGGPPHSTLMRLPGYPLFLAACFSFFGMQNYVAVAWVQIVMDLAACLLLAGCARRIAPDAMKEAAWHGTLWLAALCPFTAIYAGTPLTEGPTVFLLALALWAAAVFVQRPGWCAALIFTAAVTAAALLRPDGALAAVALAPVLLVALSKSARPHRRRMAAACVLLALAPFAVWTWRNWRVFHVVQPLAPQSAADPGEPLTPGWSLWVRTWALDFDSTYSVYWNAPGAPLNLEYVPPRAFRSPAERADAEMLFREYNANGYRITPWLDAGFAGLARKRIADAPMRYYVWLPLGRVADMWLRPRVENLPIDLDWWVYENHPEETVISWSFLALNALYLALAIAGLAIAGLAIVVQAVRLRPQFRALAWAMLAYMLLRSAALAVTVVSPEARYTIECFPMLFVLGGVAIARGWVRVRARV
ncbi:MAG TPA: glycosyltransferase family 39 protein [Terracidiphilus sp.]|nr:glycosyltransferase family 39 protein [Terracidiphilus sp.]